MALHHRRRSHIWPLLIALIVACSAAPSWSAAPGKAKKPTRPSAVRKVAKAEPPAPRPPTPVHACVDGHGRSHYSQFPCAEGGKRPLQWRDDRNAHQLQEAKQTALREQRLAQAIVRDRQHDERMSEKERRAADRVRGAKRQPAKEKLAAKPERAAGKNFRARAPAQPTIQRATGL